MSTTLIVTRSHDREFNDTGETIDRDAWRTYVERARDLRWRTDARRASDLRSGATIEVAAADSEAELLGPDGPLPFLSYRSGDLVMKLAFDPYDRRGLQRRRTAAVARYFKALITHDAGDEIFDW